MEDEYKKEIVSTDEFFTYIHRTDSETAKKILKKGLKTPAGDLRLTASLQSPDLNNALNSYSQAHKGSNAVVVLHIPKAEIYNKATKKIKENIGLDPQIGYFSKGGIYIKPKYVSGWIDQKKDNKYHKNKV